MLSLVYKIFEDFRCVSQLTLKPAKCILITTVCKSSNWNHDMIRAFLRRNVPGWANIIIRDSAKYLGFIVGPTAGAVQWDGALEKFNGRCIDLKLSEQPLGQGSTTARGAHSSFGSYATFEVQTTHVMDVT